MKTMPSSQYAGFTLIELMVVIVIMSIMASLVVLNIGGVDQRKAMQVREMLILDFKKINREANDQSRIYAFDVQNATDVAPSMYQFKEYTAVKTSLINTKNSNNAINTNTEKKWDKLQDFNIRSLPDRVSLRVEAEDRRYENANNSDLIGDRAPTLIWFGNGEAKPASVQVYYDQHAIGAPIRIDYLGKVLDEN